MAFFLLGFFQAAKTDLSNHIHKFRFHFFGLVGSNINRFQFIRDDTLCIQLFDLAHALYAQRVLLTAVWQHIPHEVLENIFLDEIGPTFGYLDRICILGEMLESVQVSVELIVKTAFETAALSAQFALVDAKVLVTRCGGVH